MAKRRKSKKKNRVYFGLIIITLVITLVVGFIYNSRVAKLSDFETRGLWLSYLDLTDFNYSSQKEYQKDLKKLSQTIEENDLNTVYIQVRPFQDAYYNLGSFPRTYFIKNCPFDPLKVFLNYFKDTDVKVIAWINPYRIGFNDKTVSNFRYQSWLKDDHVIQYNKTSYILNPANKESQDLIITGVKEVISNYNVDGVIFDDYFYIQGTHANTTKPGRLKNVNQLVKKVYRMCHEYDKSFGISCAGNYENCINEGADIDTWLKNDCYIDYLMPQIYWSSNYVTGGKSVNLFKNRIKQFSKLKRSSSVTLYAALSLYNCGEVYESDQGWSKSDLNISDQIQMLYRSHYKGFSYFRYSSMEKKAVKKELKNVLDYHEDIDK